MNLIDKQEKTEIHIHVRIIHLSIFRIMAHGCFTMKRCVAYILDPDTTSNFDLKVKFIGFLNVFMSSP